MLSSLGRSCCSWHPRPEAVWAIRSPRTPKRMTARAGLRARRSVARRREATHRGERASSGARPADYGPSIERALVSGGRPRRQAMNVTDRDARQPRRTSPSGRGPKLEPDVVDGCRGAESSSGHAVSALTDTNDLVPAPAWRVLQPDGRGIFMTCWTPTTASPPCCPAATCTTSSADARAGHDDRHRGR